MSVAGDVSGEYIMRKKDNSPFIQDSLERNIDVGFLEVSGFVHGVSDPKKFVSKVTAEMIDNKSHLLVALTEAYEADVWKQHFGELDIHKRYKTLLGEEKGYLSQEEIAHINNIGIFYFIRKKLPKYEQLRQMRFDRRLREELSKFFRIFWRAVFSFRFISSTLFCRAHSSCECTDCSTAPPGVS